MESNGYIYMNISAEHGLVNNVLCVLYLYCVYCV